MGRDSLGIVFIEKFIPNPDEIFEYLLTNTRWDTRMKARQTASFGLAHNYSQIDYPDVEIPPVLLSICSQIEHQLNFSPNNCLANYYLDGQSTMGFHSDTSTGLSPGNGVGILSLGAEREMKFKSKHNPVATQDITLTNGSLIYLTEETQEDWLHAIPKKPNAGPRISLSFRSIQVNVD